MRVIYDEKEFECAFSFAISLINGKWKGIILWYLQGGTLRYGELRRLLGNITQKMLTQTLRELEKDGLIERTVYPVVPPKVEYTITQNGEKLLPIFKALQEWGEEVGSQIGEVLECKMSQKL